MGTDDLDLPIKVETSALPEIEPCDSTLPKQLRQKVEPLNCEIVGVDKQGSTTSHFEGCTDDSKGLNSLPILLHALAELHRSHSSLESLLRTACRIVVNIMCVEHCSIGWLDENELDIRIWASHTRKGAHENIDQVYRAFSELINRKRPSRSVSSGLVYRLSSDCGLLRRREIIAPLRIDKQIVGYVCGLKNKCSNVPILNSERTMLATLSHHISLAIEAHRTREMLKCPCIALALSTEERASFTALTSMEQPFLETINDSEKVVRKIAHGFVADLYRFGFETKQILRVATEILDGVVLVLRKTK